MKYGTAISKIIGTTFRSTAVFKDFDGTPVMPGSVVFKYKKPGESTVSVPVTSATTTYQTDVYLDVVGEWKFRWECSGSYAAAEEFSVVVNKSDL